MKSAALILSAALLFGASQPAYADDVRPDGKGGYRITDEKGRVKGYIDKADGDNWVVRDTKGKVKSRIQTAPTEGGKRKRKDTEQDDEE